MADPHSRSSHILEDLPSQEKHKRLCEQVCHYKYVSVGWPYVGGFEDRSAIHLVGQRGARTEGCRF